MNCSSARQRLLTLPDPAAVPAGVAGHLAACAGCQAWHRLLIQVESAVAALPVPAADPGRKRQVIEQFRADPVRKTRSAPPAPGVRPVVTPAPAPASAGQRLARLWPIGLVAAALLVGTLSWVILSGKPPQPGPMALGSDPMLDRIIAAKFKTESDTPVGRLEGWSDMAGEIHEQAKALNQVTPAHMNSLAVMYERIVGEEALVATARSLSAEEREAVLPQYTVRLLAAEEDAKRLATVAPPLSHESLLRIAAAANASRIKLTQLRQGRGT